MKDVDEFVERCAVEYLRRERAEAKNSRERLDDFVGRAIKITLHAYMIQDYHGGW